MVDFIDTIAAISTAPGAAALAIVRLSGPEALDIAGRIFVAGEGVVGKQGLKNHQAIHGFLIDPGTQRTIDEVVLTPFLGPHTYTGEDLVEISCHGGFLISAEVLSLLLHQGARLSRRGEFTQRAFLAGRIDLTQAEAVLDVIQSKTSCQGRRSLAALCGQLGKQIKEIRQPLLDVLTRIIAGIDFPEEMGDAPEPEIQAVVRQCIEKLEQLLKAATSGRFLRDGLKLAIVGRPNAGKSSLLNRLLNFERAIVTDIPGTTRDALEEIVDVNGVPVILVDTAGVRHTADIIEQIGIDRTRAAVEQSDLVLLIVDLLEGWGQPEEQIEGMIADKPFLLVGNKLDVAVSAQQARDNFPVFPNCTGELFLSAKTGENLDNLTTSIEQFVFKDSSLREEPSLNMRQAELCRRAIEALRHVEKTLEQGLPQDCLSCDLKIAIQALGEISGEAVTEEILTQVFANFCIGK